MKRVRKNSGLWDYLNTIGILDKGSDAIKQAKRDYRRQYIRGYKRDRRRTKKEYCLLLDKDEEQIISEIAKKHGLSPTRYIKKAVLAYPTQSYIVPASHSNILNRINQLMLRCQTAIEQIANKERGTWYRPEKSYDDLEKIIRTIQNDINESFANPPLLQTVILSALQTNPAFIEILKKIIANHDPQKHVP